MPTISCTAFLFVSAGNSIWAEEILPPPHGGNRRDFVRYSYEAAASPGRGGAAEESWSAQRGEREPIWNPG